MVLLAAELARLPSIQVRPQSVKAAVTGVGRASKAQVKQMVKKLTSADISNRHACDAAAAIAELLQRASRVNA